MPEKFDPDKMQKEIMEAVQKLMSQRTATKSPETARAEQETEEKKRERRRKALQFDLKPKDVKRYLDRFVIKQEEAKRVLATTVCDHYNHVRECSGGQECKDYERS